MTHQLPVRRIVIALFRGSLIAAIFFTLIGLATTAQALELRARVADVTDGDTIVVIVDGKRARVRLIGIDTPESRPNHRAALQSQSSQRDQKTILQQGKRASAFTRQLIRIDEYVTLEFDVQQRDHYQRMLAYVWLPNKKMANEEILKAGFAYLLTVPPNIKYRQRLANAFKEARAKRRGLWADATAILESTSTPKGKKPATSSPPPGIAVHTRR
jgi:micrococcal nuclease